MHQGNERAFRRYCGRPQKIRQQMSCSKWFFSGSKTENRICFLRNDSITLGGTRDGVHRSELNGLLRVDSVSTDGKELGVGRYETVFENH